MNYKQCIAMEKTLRAQREEVRTALKRAGFNPYNQTIGQTVEIILTALIAGYAEAAKEATDRGVA